MEELGEIHIGEWQGLTLAELDRREDWRRFNTHRAAFRAPGGESMLEAQTRMVNALDRLRENHPNDAVAVVSHGDPLRAALLYYLGMPIDFVLRIDVNPGSLTVCEAGDWGARVLSLNTAGDALP